MEYYLLFLFEIFSLFFLSRRLTSQIYRLLHQLTGRTRITNWIFSLIFLPGTLLHELSHFLTALFLFVPVDKLELMPENEGNSIKMGSVSMAKTDPFRSFIIAIAPFILGIVFIFGITSYFLKNQLFSDLRWSAFVVYLLFVVGNTMFTSKKDIQGTYKLIVILLFFYILFRLVGVQISLVRFLENAIPVVQKASYYLLFPILIDAASLFGFRLIFKK